jgi:hypothetical protein
MFTLGKSSAGSLGAGKPNEQPNRDDELEVRWEGSRTASFDFCVHKLRNCHRQQYSKRALTLPVLRSRPPFGCLQPAHTTCGTSTYGMSTARTLFPDKFSGCLSNIPLTGGRAGCREAAGKRGAGAVDGPVLRPLCTMLLSHSDLLHSANLQHSPHGMLQAWLKPPPPGKACCQAPIA